MTIQKNNKTLQLTATSDIIKDAIINKLEDDLYKKNNPNRYTKFDSDNDAFLGKIGESVFKNHLIDLGYRYEINFHDNLSTLAKKISTNDRTYDPYDFSISYEYLDSLGNTKTKTELIDIKTQYCINNKLYNGQWQMAVNSNTINKIINSTRQLDSFVFIFSDANWEDYLKKVCELLSTNKEDPNLIEKIKSSNLTFDPITLDVVGTIKCQLFDLLSVKYTTNEVFRVNFNKYKNELIPWKTADTMHRIYIDKLDSINHLIVPRRINLPFNGSKENLLAYNEFMRENFSFADTAKIQIVDSYDETNKITTIIPLGNYTKGFQFSGFSEFMTETHRWFNEINQNKLNYTRKIKPN